MEKQKMKKYRESGIKVFKNIISEQNLIYYVIKKLKTRRFNMDRHTFFVLKNQFFVLMFLVGSEATL